MRHLVVGAGGIGGMLAVLLARAGEDVTLLLRPGSVGAHPGVIEMRSVIFGDAREKVDAVSTATATTNLDVVWITVKATGLDEAMRLLDPAATEEAAVVPLLNGVDHMAVLRERHRSVNAATIRVESHRTAPGVVEQRSPFASIGLATAGQPNEQKALSALELMHVAGFETGVTDDETSLLWDKLAFLAPVALTTAAWDLELGRVRQDPMFAQCQQEAVSAARADGATTELAAVQAVSDGAPDSMSSSMRVDLRAGREPELEAIGGAVLRRTPTGEAPATQILYNTVAARAKAFGAP